jgi:arginyl-tRNA synthetase
MNTFKKLIYEIIKKYLEQEQLALTNWVVEYPKDTAHGDYSSNIAFLLAKHKRMAPFKIAENVLPEITKIAEEKAKGWLEITALKGFVNFKLTNKALLSKLAAINEDYGQNIVAESKKILLEYVSANPTGPLHIGHGRWAALGDSVARILSWSGHEVSKEFYINDAGIQIQKLQETVEAVKKGQKVPEDGYHGSYIEELAAQGADPVETILDQQKRTLQNFGVEFEEWFSEKTLHAEGKVQHGLEVLKEKALSYEKDGALWFKSTLAGDDKDRVLVKSDGAVTYFAADIAYHINKIERGFDTLINIWGADHHGYVQRLKGVLKLIYDFKDVDDHFKVILGQLVFLYRNGQEVRMSKRTGDIITLNEVVEEIGSDAGRYFLVMKSPDNTLDFDLELAKEQNANNPVYYVQYAHARINSIINKAEYSPEIIASYELHEKERALILKLCQFEEDLLEITKTLEPFKLARYSQELAQLFHGFYHDCRVISADVDLSKQRLAYIQKTKIVLKIALNLLGVSAPARM